MKYFLFLALTFLLSACQSREKKQQDNSAFRPAERSARPSDMDVLLTSGEGIIGTISGPDTYYEYRGMTLGLQYALAADFAQTEGLQLQVELATDTATLVRQLKDEEIDFICLQLPLSYIKRHGLRACGAHDAHRHTSWAVRPNQKGLARALDAWFRPGKETSISRQSRKAYAERNYVRRKVRAPYLSREKGIISTYDALFKKASASTGWDWRLIAAQCYQESGFDPQAVSWAGARGLMQVMPRTASQLGVAEDALYDPAENVAAAARYIRLLSGRFGDIRNRAERIKFVLASYNGGYAHIRDAMALTRKHGGDPARWEHVGEYVRKLSQPTYYRDPVVKSGYMIGSETYGYVNAVMERWRLYGGSMATGGGIDELHSSPIRATKRNRFTQQNHIFTPDEL